MVSSLNEQFPENFLEALILANLRNPPGHGDPREGARRVPGAHRREQGEPGRDDLRDRGAREGDGRRLPPEQDLLDGPAAQDPELGAKPGRLPAEHRAGLCLF